MHDEVIEGKKTTVLARVERLRELLEEDAEAASPGASLPRDRPRAGRADAAGKGRGGDVGCGGRRGVTAGPLNLLPGRSGPAPLEAPGRWGRGVLQENNLPSLYV